MLRSVAILLSLVAAATTALAEQTRAPAPATSLQVVVETAASGLEHPWGFQFLPDGRMLVTERPGRLKVIDRERGAAVSIAGVPAVFASGQGGLLDVALAPDFAASGTIFLSYAEPRGAGTAGTAIARARFTGTRLEDVRVIFRQQPATQGGLHFGSRIAIARDGNLFVTLGERFQRDRAQDVATHYGKVVRITADGRAPADNPKFDAPGAQPQLWSIGHRNPQSAAIHPETGKLWVVEHGARGGDEINIPLAGKNYGWPVISYGIDYSGAKLGVGRNAPGMEQPAYYWDPSIAPSGMAFYTGNLMPQWKGNLFVGALAAQHLSRLILDGERVVGEEKLLAGRGDRIRDVREGPDGAIYVAVDHPQGSILRITAK